MKELSIEEKANAYDNVRNKIAARFGSNVAQEIFSEYEESEDEKIRKELINFLQLPHPKFVGERKQEKWLVWLEKQGEKTNPYSGVSFEYNGHIWGMCARDNGVDILLDKQLFKHLEKQGEKKYIDDLTQQEAMDIAVAKCFEQDGQKPVDKVEPKFKKGQWIVFNGLTLYINEVVQGYYRTTSIGGIPNSYDWNIDNVARLWTVQDAKDGDVLHSTGWYNDCIFIFNGLDNWKFDEPNGDRAVATGYCCLFVSADNMEFGIQGPGCVEVNTIKPATKIQRDLLFRKMKVSGYEWDTDKKELKLLITNGGDFCESENCEQNPADWSEEDEEHLNSIISDIKTDMGAYPRSQEVIDIYNDDISFLKSLRDRVQPQPKQEWKQENREELTEFENAMMHIGGSFFGENAGLDPNDTDAIKEQAELLLELAPKTEWTEEDEKMFRSLHNLIYVVRDCDCDSSKKKELSDWIESLKGRYQSKQEQEWSEEDEKIRKSLLRWLQSNSYTSIAGIQINDVIAWLERISLMRLCSNNTPNSLLKMMKRTMMLRKKQGQRPQINVTDKELAQARKEAYNEVLDKIEYHDEWPTFDDGWNAAIWYLKKKNGRPQSHWKPSDDQMHYLISKEDYEKLTNGNGNGTRK